MLAHRPPGVHRMPGVTCLSNFHRTPLPAIIRMKVGGFHPLTCPSQEPPSFRRRPDSRGGLRALAADSRALAPLWVAWRRPGENSPLLGETGSLGAHHGGGVASGNGPQNVGNYARGFPYFLQGRGRHHLGSPIQQAPLGSHPASGNDPLGRHDVVVVGYAQEAAVVELDAVGG